MCEIATQVETHKVVCVSYRRRSGEERDTVMEDDLRICTVKPFNEGERRFCFEVVSPSK